MRRTAGEERMGARLWGSVTDQKGTCSAAPQRVQTEELTLFLKIVYLLAMDGVWRLIRSGQCL